MLFIDLHKLYKIYESPVFFLYIPYVAPGSAAMRHSGHVYCLKHLRTKNIDFCYQWCGSSIVMLNKFTP